MRILLLVLLFLFVSALVIVSNENLHLRNKSEALEFGRIYYSWLLSTASNAIKTTAYVVKADWLPHSAAATNISK